VNSDLFSIAMSAAVPLRIMALVEKGGPDAEDYAKAQAHNVVLGERGDVMLFGGGKNGEAADLFNKTAQAIAILAFCPGGVTLFNQTFDAKDYGWVRV